MYPLKTGCFFTWHNFLKVHLSCTCHYFIPFECWVVVHGMDIPQFVGKFTYWKMVWVVFSLGLLQIRLLRTFVRKCLHEKEVKFFWCMFKSSFELKHEKTHHVVWDVWWLNNHGWGCFSANRIFSKHHGSEEISTIVSHMLKLSLIPLAFILILFYPPYSRVNISARTSCMAECSIFFLIEVTQSQKPAGEYFINKLTGQSLMCIYIRWWGVNRQDEE